MKRVGSWTCSDGERGHPIEHVVVTVRCGNYSAFNGYHFTRSDYGAALPALRDTVALERALRRQRPGRLAHDVC